MLFKLPFFQLERRVILFWYLHHNGIWPCYCKCAFLSFAEREQLNLLVSVVWVPPLGSMPSPIPLCFLLPFFYFFPFLWCLFAKVLRAPFHCPSCHRCILMKGCQHAIKLVILLNLSPRLFEERVLLKNLLKKD